MIGTTGAASAAFVESSPGGDSSHHSGGPGRPRTRRLVVAVVAAVCVMFAGWWSTTGPQLEGGGVAGVSSSDHEVVMATGFRETVYVVPADETGSSTLAFGIYNHGRLPVKIVEVWPDADETLCFWTPSQRWFQDDPRYMGVLDDRAQPAEGAVLGPGRSATIWITGSHPNPARCVHAGMNVHDDVELTVRVLGRASTTHVPLGYTFGYSDDPTALRTSYDYRVLPPRPQSNG